MWSPNLLCAHRDGTFNFILITWSWLQWKFATHIWFWKCLSSEKCWDMRRYFERSMPTVAFDNWRYQKKIRKKSHFVSSWTVQLPLYTTWNIRATVPFQSKGGRNPLTFWFKGSIDELEKFEYLHLLTLMRRFIRADQPIRNVPSRSPWKKRVSRKILTIWDTWNVQAWLWLRCTRRT